MERIRVFFFRDSTSFSLQLSWDPNWLVLWVAQVKLGDLGLAQCSVDRERDLVAWQTNICFLFEGRKKLRTHYGGNLWNIHPAKLRWKFQNEGLFQIIFLFKGGDFQVLWGSINKGGWERVGWMFFGPISCGNILGYGDVRCSVCLSLQHQSALFVSIFFRRERNPFLVSSLFYATS